MCTRAQYTDLTYMGATVSCRPMKIIFGSVIKSWYILWTDEDNFWQCNLELVYKPKYQIWCESDFPCAQDPGVSVWFIWEVPDAVNQYGPFSILTSVWIIQACVLVNIKSIALCARTISCLPLTDGRALVIAQMP